MGLTAGDSKSLKDMAHAIGELVKIFKTANENFVRFAETTAMQNEQIISELKTSNVPFDEDEMEHRTQLIREMTDAAQDLTEASAFRPMDLRMEEHLKPVDLGPEWALGARVRVADKFTIGFGTIGKIMSATRTVVYVQLSENPKSGGTFHPSQLVIIPEGPFLTYWKYSDEQYEEILKAWRKVEQNEVLIDEPFDKSLIGRGGHDEVHTIKIGENPTAEKYPKLSGANSEAMLNYLKPRILTLEDLRDRKAACLGMAMPRWMNEAQVMVIDPRDANHGRIGLVRDIDSRTIELDFDPGVGEYEMYQLALISNTTAAERQAKTNPLDQHEFIGNESWRSHTNTVGHKTLMDCEADGCVGPTPIDREDPTESGVNQTLGKIENFIDRHDDTRD